MNTVHLEDKFARLGARVRFDENPGRRWNRPASGVVLDIGQDRDGEFFRISRPLDRDAVELAVLDVQPRDRHLLLLAREAGGKSKFLCGHDERHWFVAAVPESAPVGTVRDAKEALKPPAIVQAQSRLGLRSDARNRRKNAAFRRQGEWFFVPAPDLSINEKFVLRDEPIRRGGGKPHWADFAYRTGGVTVHVCRRHPNGVEAATYARILRSQPEAASWNWSIMRRDPELYVRGRVRHADHKTITLHGWHRVWMNTETQARAMQHVAFLD